MIPLKPRTTTRRLKDEHRNLKAGEYVTVPPATAACIVAHYRNHGGRAVRQQVTAGSVHVQIIKEKTK